jgi:transposase
LVAQQLVHIDFLDGLIERVSAEIAERVRPFEEEVVLLDTIPGIGRRSAEIFVAEVGADLRRFPTAAHLAAWAGLAPGNNESAGKRRPATTRKGSPWLRAALVAAALAAGRTKTTDVGAQYRRLLPRKGRRRAAVAVAHTLLVMAYHILTRREPYHELGANDFDERARQSLERRLVHRLEALGYTVSLQPPGSVA